MADNRKRRHARRDPVLYQRGGGRPPSGPAPRTADGTPDLSGVWFPGPDIEPEVTPFQPWAAAEAKNALATRGRSASTVPSHGRRPHAHDRPRQVRPDSESPGRAGGGGVPGVRQVFLDGRKHPAQSSADLARPLRGTLGEGHAGRRLEGLQRQGMARRRSHRPNSFTWSSAIVESISATSNSRSQSTIQAPIPSRGRSGAFCGWRSATRSWSSSATRTTRPNTTSRDDASACHR